MVKIPGVIKTTAGAAIASAATVNLANATGNSLHITGSTGPITSFGTVAASVIFTLIFDSTPTITHNATSLILPTGANIVAAAGDTMILRSEGSGNWKCISYTRADGYSLIETAPSSISPDILEKSFTLGSTMTALDVAYIDTSGNINTWGGYKTTGDTFSTGSNVVYSRHIMVDTNTVVTAFQITGTSISLVAGTISNNVITYGTPVFVVNSNGFNLVKADTNSGCIFILVGTAYKGYPFTVSGTTITVGTGVQVNGSTSSTLASSVGLCQISTNKIAFVYISGASAQLNARIGTISANVLSLGTEATNISGDVHTLYTSICKSDTDKFIVSAQNGTTLKTLACSVSGTTISNGSTISTTMLTTVSHGLLQVGTNMVMLLYSLASDSVAKVLTMSGNVITAQTAYVVFTGVNFITSGDTRLLGCPFGTNTFALGGFTGTNGSQKIVYVRVNTTTYFIDVLETIDYAISVSNPAQYTTGKILIAPDANPGKTYIANNNARNIVGIIQESGTVSDSKKVALTGAISSGHSSLEPGEAYYIQAAGGIGLPASLYSASTSNLALKKVGNAISATEIIINII